MTRILMGDSLLSYRFAASVSLIQRADFLMGFNYDSARMPQDTMYASAVARYAVAMRLYRGGYYVESNRLSGRAAAAFYAAGDFPQAFYSLLLQVGNLMQIGAYNEAFPTLLRAHALASNLHDQSLIATAQDWIGQLYMMQGNPQAALLYYEDAVAKSRAMTGPNADPILVNRLAHLAEAYLAVRRYDTARIVARQALDLRLRAPNVSPVPALLAWGGALSGLKEHSDAAKSYQLALDTARASGNPLEEVLALRAIGELRAEQGRFQEADQILGHGCQIASDRGMIPILASLLSLRAKVLTPLSPTRALRYLQKAVELKDSLSQISTQQQMNVLHARYGLELKQHQIEVQDLALSRAKLQRQFLVLLSAIALLIVCLLAFFLRKLSLRSAQLALLNSTKDIFFSIISHDTKSIAISIRNMLAQMDARLDQMTPQQLGHYIRLLHQASEGQTRLLDNLLHWARLQLKAVRFEPVRADLHDLTMRVLELFTLPLREKALQLDLAGLQQGILAWGDEGMIRAILRNLLSNAVKFSPRGATIRLACGLSQRGEPWITVADKGLGMDHEQIQKLGRIDGRLSRVGTEGEQGTGLGLILCYAMARRNGAVIHVQSQPGNGTTIRLTLRAGPRRAKPIA